ncbi:reverse transcriptase domain-containing protein [Oceanobacillus sp. AG]|uniref:reverse transcriptase domain-containing protein n=1 Tax=Oceanobacillus sp. AG TaxID=2681969 RepID=UPI00351A5EB9
MTDRLIQQAVAQVLSMIYDPKFSEHSNGFRPNRSAHDAVRKAKGYIQDGYRWVVDMDLEKFFDNRYEFFALSILIEPPYTEPYVR